MAKVILILKTEKLPATCKECELKLTSFFYPGDVGCIVLKDWITSLEYSDGKVKLDNCPLLLSEVKL